MKTSVSFLLAFFFGSIVFGQSTPNYSAKSLIVKLNPAFVHYEVNYESLDFGIAALDELNHRNKLNEIRVLNPGSKGDFFKLGFVDDIEIIRAILHYESLGFFDIVEPDYLGHAGGASFSFKPNDDFYDRQWSLNNQGGFDLAPTKQGADIDMEAAWEITKGSEEVVIAVLDSGIRNSHTEFTGRIWNNIDETETATDADQNGYVGDVRGFDFTNKDNSPADDHGHGTNVAGILAANGNNSRGYAGVNWNCKIMPLKILDHNGSGFYSAWIEAIFYAVDNGAHVLNMSVGGSSFSAGMKEAFEHAIANGVTTVACMMNENNSVTYYPAGYQETIAIGSTDPDDMRSNRFPWDNSKGSNFGGHIDLSAPGNYIYGLSHSHGNEYGIYWSGTSQAAPHVAGVAGLLLSMNPDLGPEEIRSILKESAEDQVGNNSEDLLGWDQYHGAGRLNAFNALNLLLTSIDDIPSSDFKISNNLITAGDIVDLSFPSARDKQLFLVSVEGRILHNSTLKGKQYSITETNLAPGVYFIKIIEKGTNYNAQKLIIE